MAKRSKGQFSREKGKEGEREVANILKARGYKGAHRSQQYCGDAKGTNNADVIEGPPGIHIEVKRVEKLNLNDAMTQSITNAKEGEIPTVFHRQNRRPWKVTLLLDDFLKIVERGDRYGNQGNAGESPALDGRKERTGGDDPAVPV